ncbi:siderophore-interacting protein [Actinomadura livida]|uniref:NADPH-dependent ferric siderophore reductase n=1 Tax=Actinomadura livida TaxID=79909 RepID=A0A7W7IJ12_9ACTN|nr:MULTISPECIES: siderophore-interacting protein [Actinomadura]MBB4777895.1 NADPH-dependent ferric siderophore reductase [Actinomadura catellatispora]GGT97933.1 siderophore-interacting protein [Actinomadura livida]
MSIDRRDPRGRVLEHHRTGTGVRRIGYPIGIRTVRVVRREQITRSILRLTVGGPELDGFHTYQADDHVKIVFPDADGARRLPVVNADLELDWPRPLPPARKYTIRRFDAEARELDLDFVLHPGGLASDWAAAARPGDEVAVAGPPGAKAFPHNYDHYLFAVDATALPAAARWLEESPQDVSARLVIETGDAADHAYPLAARDGVEVTWLVRDGERSPLADAVRALDPPAGRTFLFAAGEAGAIKPLRAWARELKGEGRLDALFTGYWKRGVAGLEDD